MCQGLILLYILILILFESLFPSINSYSIIFISRFNKVSSNALIFLIINLKDKELHSKEEFNEFVINVKI